MKILVIAKGYPPATGGIETYSEKLAQAYAKLGHDVTVVTTHPGPPKTERRDAVKVTNLGERSQPVVFAAMANWMLRNRHRQFDLVHATTWRVAIPAIMLRPAAPLLVTIHGREVFIVPKLLRPVMKAVLNRADAVPTVSGPILERAKSLAYLPLHRGFSNWNGISFEAETQEMPVKPDGPIRIFCMCRMVARKNVASAIRAVATLVREGKDMRFDIAGSGPELDSLRKIAEAENVGDRIQIHGRIADPAVPEFYRLAHIFLHPQVETENGTDIEGFGLVIADAMAFGCVPVAGDSGGPSEFISNGQNGYLVDGNEPGQIIIALRNLVDDRPLMDRIGGSAHRFACSELLWKKHAERNLAKLPS